MLVDPVKHYFYIWLIHLFSPWQSPSELGSAHLAYRKGWAQHGTADIFRGIMVSLYVKGKENGHGQAYAPTGAMVLK